MEDIQLSVAVIHNEHGCHRSLGSEKLDDVDRGTHQLDCKTPPLIPASGTVIRQADFDFIIGQCVESERNIACATFIKHRTPPPHPTPRHPSDDKHLSQIYRCPKNGFSFSFFTIQTLKSAELVDISDPGPPNCDILNPFVRPAYSRQEQLSASLIFPFASCWD